MRKAAAQYWPAGELPVAEPVMLTIAFFYSSALIDVDNIPKPISDALKGLVYEDDKQVTDVLCRKRNRNVFRIKNISSVLADGLNRSNEFLYIVVNEAPDQEAI